jgi:hypothetical protein
MALATLSTLYALTLVSARAGVMNRPQTTLSDTLYPIAVVLGLSVVVGAVLALALRVALRVMNPTSENTSILLITLIAAGAALAAHFGGSAPLAALLGGLLLKQLNPKPWAWSRQLGTAASLLVMLMFVLVSVVAAKADWNPAVAGLVALLVAARAVAKIAGVRRQLGQRHRFSPGILDRMRDVAYVVGGIAAGVAVRRVLADTRAAHRAASRCPPSCSWKCWAR